MRFHLYKLMENSVDLSFGFSVRLFSSHFIVIVVVGNLAAFVGMAKNGIVKISENIHRN